MSAKAQCSDITLPEIGGLICNLMQKLTGPRAIFWLKALKRLDRKENPWIHFDKILEVPEGSERIQSIKDSLGNLDALGISVFDCWQQLLAQQDKIPHLLDESLGIGRLPTHHIVSVRLGDLLSFEEREKFTYQKLLDKAREEYALDRCDLRGGLAAAVKLTLQAMSTENQLGHCQTYIICSSTFKVNDNADRVPEFSVYTGARTNSGREHNQGLCTLISISGTYGKNMMSMDLIKPETLLIFRSIPQ